MNWSCRFGCSASGVAVEPVTLNLAVTALAEFVHRRGDLHARLDARTRAGEGIDAQRRAQARRPDGYQRERAVAVTLDLAGMRVRLAGRIDGCDLSQPAVLVEEFKTTRADPERAHAHAASVHWAQARLYGALLSAELADGRDVRLRLCYLHPDSLAMRRFERLESAASLQAFFEQTIAQYERWLAAEQQHLEARDRALGALDFPYPDFRPFQKAIARRVFKALRDREALLLEAPTGSGKTMATLFPSARALAGAGYRRVFFLTSRSTGAAAARDAAARIDPGAGFLRQVTIVAREKACLMPGTPCEPDACPFARGYYDRRTAAVAALLARRAATPECVAEVAQAHTVCPFELSLDVASWSDVIIADYNYLLDPVVRLQRFDRDSEAALLVDESHQLAPRVRDMLSLAFSRDQVRDALGEGLPEPLARRVRSLDRSLLALRRERTLQREQIIARPDALLRSMQRFADALAASDLALEPWPATRELWFTCTRWLRSDAWYDPERFRYAGAASGRQINLRLICLDPGPYIRNRLEAYGGHVRFSGTVSPLPLYGLMHGLADAPAERAGNPYRPDQLRVLVVSDVPTYLQRRADSVGALATLIQTMTRTRAGHYLAAFPSFAYLELCAAELARRYPDLALACQKPAMDGEEQRTFLSRFQASAPPALGLVVLGGVFGESVDFAAARLSGIVCVGVGLPPPSLARQALQEHFDGQGSDGQAVAYQQPAMVKVLQMAGRLLRGPDHRGVLCLVDPRFRHSAFSRFFPDHWQPNVVGRADVQRELQAFWNGGPHLPRNAAAP